MGRIRVYIVDDHTMVRDGLRAMLAPAADIELCGEAGDRETARREALALRPHVVLADVRLPDGSGVELIRELRSRDEHIRSVVLTSNPDVETFFQSVVAGAFGFLVKDVGRDELHDAIRTVAGGGTLIHAETVDELRSRSRNLPPTSQLLADLTGQEQRILWMVTDGMTNREIADELTLAEKTVRNYVSNILAKVGVRTARSWPRTSRPDVATSDPATRRGSATGQHHPLTPGDLDAGEFGVVGKGGVAVAGLLRLRDPQLHAPERWLRGQLGALQQPGRGPSAGRVLTSAGLLHSVYA